MRSMGPVAAALTSSSSQPPETPAGQQETKMHAQRPDQRPDGREHSVISSIHDTTNTTDKSSNPSSSGGSSSHNSSSEHSSDRSSSSDSSRPIPESSSNVPGGYPEFNQNYDEQSDSSYPASDGAADVADDDDDDDGLFDDDEDADEKAKRIAIAAAAALQNDRGQSDDDDDYDDDYDYGEPARPPPRHAEDDDSSFRSDDSSSSSSSSFSSRRKSATKLGSNDAIKFIDTPHGKVGFVYQAPAAPAFADSEAKAKGSKAGGNVDVFDDDEDDEAVGFARRKTVQGNAQSGNEAPKQRITPVLTADGKVALLYRGASDSGSTGKYEPIRNLTSYEEPAASTAAPATTVVEYTTLTLQTSTTSTTSTTTVRTTTTTATFVGGRLAAIGGADNTEENAILPNINRPLSEVLGIKKNQFTQFRIADHGQPGVPAPPPQLPPMDFGGYRHHGVEEPTNRVPDATVMRSESHRPTGAGDQQHSQIAAPPALRPSYDDATGDQDDQDIGDLDPNYTDALSKTEVVNLAIIPAFDSDLLAIQEQEDRRAAAEAAENGYGGEYGGQQRTHYRHRTTQNRRKAEDLSAIHCAMQAMVAIAALATVFGMLGAYFKTRVLDQLQLQHWWEMVGVRYWVGLSRRGGVVL